MVEGDLPSTAASALDYVTQLDAGSTVDVSRPVSDAARDFLVSKQQTLVLLGDAGCGKSTFMWQLADRLLGACGSQLLDTPTSRIEQHVFPVVVPVYIELKLHKASELGGLLDRFLANAGLSMSVIGALRAQDPSYPWVRLVVLADGFDELQGDLASVRNFVGTICGGAPWPASLLRVIVTSRENRMGDRGSESTAFGGQGAHRRLFMLPFSRARVRFPSSFFLLGAPAYNGLVCNAGLWAVLLASWFRLTITSLTERQFWEASFAAARSTPQCSSRVRLSWSWCAIPSSFGCSWRRFLRCPRAVTSSRGTTSTACL